MLRIGRFNVRCWKTRASARGNDLKEQTLQALRNVEKALLAAGGTLTDSVSMRLYIVDYTFEKAPAIKDALLTTFAGRQPPACTWIGVAALADEGFMIEIEVTAVLADE